MVLAHRDKARPGALACLTRSGTRFTVLLVKLPATPPPLVQHRPAPCRRRSSNQQLASLSSSPLVNSSPPPSLFQHSSSTSPPPRLIQPASRPLHSSVAADPAVVHCLYSSFAVTPTLTAMEDNQQKRLNYIEETVLKKRKSSEEWAIRRREQLQERKWKIIEDKKLTFKRAEQYIKEFRSRELDLIRMKHRAKRQRTAFISPASKLLFIIRIRGKNGVHPKTQKILNSLGLKRIFNGVFLKTTEGTLAMLQIVEPYVTYGYPNLKNVRELIYKKGHANMDKQRVPLTDNNIIEQALGKYGILCIEDIVYQIANVGPHFKEVVTFLWPLTLNKPEGGLLQGKMNLFKNGGDSGNRGDQINELIAKMN
ncbi:hypothetical protein Nepgr_002262 [Nepenthes gracilis]|uniref:60S ribosomal protein L7 n=1 Tax=Nepenthes gracilis TaxID=150966 RepID=A0AAD3RY62_NEPGR|nr:hypothetical protein Nepgr_002262 [Nepenthes gracilis]